MQKINLKNQRIKNYSYNYISEHPNIKKNIENLKNQHSDKTMVFYGAGELLEYFLQKHDLSELHIKGIIDKDTAKHGKKLGNYTIYPPEELKNINPDLMVLTIYPKENILLNDGFTNFLIKTGIPIFQNLFHIEEKDFLEIKEPSFKTHQ